MAVAYTGSMNDALTTGMTERKRVQTAPDRGGVVDPNNANRRGDLAVGRPDVPERFPPQHNLPSDL